MKKLITRLGLIAIAICFIQTISFSQQTISGVIVDSSDEPIIGASIIIVGTTTGTISDIDGSYSLNVPDGVTQIEVSYIGYGTQTINIADGNFANIVMADDFNQLDEVVVTGLASSVKRSNLANSVATISSAELTGVTSQQTVDGALYGKLTGVNIVQSNGAPGGGIALRLRGVSSLSGNNQPLWIVDGIYISNAEIPSGSRFASGANSGSEEGASNRIADLNPEDIESIEVLKGASAAAIYGTRANAGVVIVTTKKGKSGKTKISVDQDLGFNTILNRVGRFQHDVESVREAFGDDEADRFAAAEAAGEIVDLEEEIYGQNGFIRDTRVKISGGNEKTTFYVGGSIRDEEGIIENTGFDRNSLRLNLSHKISPQLSLSLIHISEPTRPY